MSWTILSVRGPKDVVGHPHNALYHTLDESKHVDDCFTIDNSRKGDDGTPAPQSLPPEDILHLTTSHFPKIPSVGFVFGSDKDKCDILLPMRKSVSKRQFAITFDTSTGAVILRNLDTNYTNIHMLHAGEKIKLSTQRHFGKETIMVRFYGLDIQLSRPWGDPNDESKYYPPFLDKLAKAAPSLDELRLSSVAGTSVRSYASQEQSLYRDEVFIGKGASAVVYRASHIRTGAFVAIKRYETWHPEVLKELRIHRSLKHENIIKFFQFSVRDGEKAELIMEFAPLGNLATQNKALKFTIAEGRAIIQQTLQALGYLHGRSLTHCDIKPDNILIISRDPIHAKVADFGASKEAGHQNKFCGTLRYAAPEMHGQSYTSKVDIWSIGVIVMELWMRLPETREDSYLWAGKLIEHKENVPFRKTKELLDSCLQVEPDERATAEKCLSLPFFRSGTDGNPNATLVNDIDESCKTVDSDIPDTAPCNMEDSEPPRLPDGSNCEEFAALLSQEEIAASNPLFVGWNGEEFGPILVQKDRGEQRSGISSNRPGNPIEAETCIPAAVNDHETNTRAISRGAAPNYDGTQKATALHDYHIDNEGTIYSFFSWYRRNIAYIPDRSMVNITQILKGPAHGRVGRPERREFADYEKLSVTGGSNSIKGTYLLYRDALQVCSHFEIDTTGLPDFIKGNGEDRHLLQPDSPRFEFFSWQGTSIAHIPSQGTVNIIHMFKALKYRQKYLEDPKLQAMLREKQNVDGAGAGETSGTYILYQNAVRICTVLEVDTSLLPDFMEEQGMAEDDDQEAMSKDQRASAEDVQEGYNQEDRALDSVQAESGIQTRSKQSPSQITTHGRNALQHGTVVRNQRKTKVATLGFLFDRLARMDVGKRVVSMQLDDGSINASELFHAAAVPRVEVYAYLRKIRMRSIVKRNGGKAPAWIPFRDGVFLCQALGLEKKLQPLLLKANVVLPAREDNYLIHRIQHPRRALTVSKEYSILCVRNCKVPHKPSQRLINVTALLKAGGILRQSINDFLQNKTKINKQVLGNRGSIIHGTYMSYEEAKTLCAKFKVHPEVENMLSVVMEESRQGDDQRASTEEYQEAMSEEASSEDNHMSEEASSEDDQEAMSEEANSEDNHMSEEASSEDDQEAMSDDQEAVSEDSTMYDEGSILPEKHATPSSDANSVFTEANNENGSYLVPANLSQISVLSKFNPKTRIAKFGDSYNVDDRDLAGNGDSELGFLCHTSVGGHF